MNKETIKTYCSALTMREVTPDTARAWTNLREAQATLFGFLRAGKTLLLAGGAFYTLGELIHPDIAFAQGPGPTDCGPGFHAASVGTPGDQTFVCFDPKSGQMDAVLPSGAQGLYVSVHDYCGSDSDCVKRVVNQPQLPSPDIVRVDNHPGGFETLSVLDRGDPPDQSVTVFLPADHNASAIHQIDKPPATNPFPWIEVGASVSFVVLWLLETLGHRKPLTARVPEPRSLKVSHQNPPVTLAHDDYEAAIPGKGEAGGKVGLDEHDVDRALWKVYNPVPTYHTGPPDHSGAPGYDAANRAHTANEQGDHIEAVFATHRIPARVIGSADVGPVRVHTVQIIRTPLDDRAAVRHEIAGRGTPALEETISQALGVPDARIVEGGIGPNVTQVHVVIPKSDTSS